MTVENRNHVEGADVPPERPLQVAGFNFPFCKGSVGKWAGELDEYDAMKVLYRIDKDKDPTKGLNKVGSNFYALYKTGKIEEFAKYGADGKHPVKLLEMDGKRYAVTCDETFKIGEGNRPKYRLTFKLLPDVAPTDPKFTASTPKELDKQVQTVVTQQIQKVKGQLAGVQQEVVPGAVPSENAAPEVDIQPANKYAPALELLSYDTQHIEITSMTQTLDNKIAYTYTDNRYPGYQMSEVANGSFPEQLTVQNSTGAPVGKLTFEYRYNESGPKGDEQMQDRYNAQMAIVKKYPNVFPMSRGNFVGFEMSGQRYILCNDVEGNVLMMTVKEAQNLGTTINDKNPRESFFIGKGRHIKDPDLASIVADFSKRTKRMYKAALRK